MCHPAEGTRSSRCRERAALWCTAISPPFVLVAGAIALVLRRFGPQARLARSPSIDPKQQFDDFRSAAAGYAAFGRDAGLGREFRGCCDAPVGGASPSPWTSLK